MAGHLEIVSSERFQDHGSALIVISQKQLAKHLRRHAGVAVGFVNIGGGLHRISHDAGIGEHLRDVEQLIGVARFSCLSEGVGGGLLEFLIRLAPFGGGHDFCDGLFRHAASGVDFCRLRIGHGRGSQSRIGQYLLIEGDRAAGIARGLGPIMFGSSDAIIDLLRDR